MLPEQLDLYDFEYYRNKYEVPRNANSWLINKHMRFGDLLAGLIYIHGISWDTMVEYFSDYFVDNPDGQYKQNQYTLQDQLNFILQKKQRTPKKVLEIGGGRGDLSTVCKFLGYEITSIEPSRVANKWYTMTAHQFFGKQYQPVVPLNIPLSDFTEDLYDYDSIVLIESLEHIFESEFEPFYEKIKTQFKGLFVTTNWKFFWPIPIGSGGPLGHLDHCRLIDDNLYDRYSNDAKRVVYRDHSHLVLEY